MILQYKILKQNSNNQSFKMYKSYKNIVGKFYKRDFIYNTCYLEIERYETDQNNDKKIFFDILYFS